MPRDRASGQRGAAHGLFAERGAERRPSEALRRPVRTCDVCYLQAGGFALRSVGVTGRWKQPPRKKVNETVSKGEKRLEGNEVVSGALCWGNCPVFSLKVELKEISFSCNGSSLV